MRLLSKTVALFVFLNLLFAFVVPPDSLGVLTFYNKLFPGRQRLPYGENSSESYNLSLTNLPAMIHSHEIAKEKMEDEYRVLIIGDSGIWGWFLENEDTLAGRINTGNFVTADGRIVRAYNLGYPVMSLLKDVMILEEAMVYQPDLIVWPVTLESFPRAKQLFAPIVQSNTGRVRALIDRYELQLDPEDERLEERSFLENSIIGQRRNLADLVRLQLYGLSWAATGIDQAIPEEIPLRRSDFEIDTSWQDIEEPINLSESILAFDVLLAGKATAGDLPLLIINEPMFISTGINSELRYNSFYPRWAYDQYREMLQTWTTDNNVDYLDLWDTIPPREFTDTPVHLTPAGSERLASLVAANILQIAAR